MKASLKVSYEGGINLDAPSTLLAPLIISGYMTAEEADLLASHLCRRRAYSPSRVADRLRRLLKVVRKNKG